MPNNTTTKRRGRPAHGDVLTPAEWRVLHATQHGFSNRAMADRMGVSLDAIKYHLRNILGKLGLPNKQTLRRTLIKSTQPAAAAINFPKPAREDYPMTTTTIASIGQIARTVGNIEQSRNWYELVLELKHLYTFGTLSFFDCGGTRLMLSQNEKLNPDESILYFRVADLIGTFEQLQKKGVDVIAAPHKIHTHADGTEEWMAFFKDPDGRPLALMSQLKP
ncbi:MAG: LuxR C-terminal-related transcriptional regulator [Pseudomonadota bacterium]